MKKNLSAVLMLSLGLVIAGSAQAQTAIATLGVSATVEGQCTATTTPIDFGIYDPMAWTDADGAVLVTCSTGLPYHIALDAGANFNGFNRYIANGTDTILYTLYADAGRTAQWGDDGYGGTYTGAIVSSVGTGGEDTHTVYATADPTWFLPPAGVYTDTVNVTVHY